MGSGSLYGPCRSLFEGTICDDLSKSNSVIKVIGFCCVWFHVFLARSLLDDTFLCAFTVKVYKKCLRFALGGTYGCHIQYAAPLGVYYCVWDIFNMCFMS